MIDEKKLIVEIEKLKSNLIHGACSSQVSMETRCKEEAYNEVLAIIDPLQEEPVSDDLEDAADKYSQSIHSDYFNDMFDRGDIYEAVIYGAKWGKHQAEVEIQAQSMALAHGCPKESITEELEEAANAYISNEINYSHSRTDTFKAGANWQKEQFEKNRLAACDRQTEKEADIECGSVVSIIEKEHRLPTFDDAIKYGMTLQKEQMKEALRTEYEKGRHDALEEMKKSKQC